MHLSKPLGGLVGLGVFLAVAGSLVTLARETVGTGAPEFSQAAAVAVVGLVVVAVVLATVVGTRGGGPATRYW